MNDIAPSSTDHQVDHQVVLIGTMLMRLPIRIKRGHVCTEAEAAWLQSLWEHYAHNIVNFRFPEPNSRSGEAFEAARQNIIDNYKIPRPKRDPETDPIEFEAMNIAREMLMARLSAEGLPAPKNLEEHCRQLINAHPQLYERAAERVRIRMETHDEMLREIGAKA